ncbi:tetratricopeptide repeat protein [Helicobacter pylori]|uniref:tetratricopeptide repeat protein n=1 Tax=Helicobacter pylori TaxID=210 RepID=UPI0013E29B1A|nr:tetratricopeptide repeat protein [Helicobacter pylori]
MAKINPEELVLLGIKSLKKQDFSQARKYFEKACDLNNGGGCGALGELYYNGEGVEKNLIKAAYFYTKSCELKDGGGCYNLGHLYGSGKGVKQDLKKAFALYEKACKLGVQEMCAALKE